ncbi:MAG: hypothetical protein IPL78_24115 [Chloroflexi bacterium]|nr:hypothetical protein [Chloroflexota bacterium]
MDEMNYNEAVLAGQLAQHGVNIIRTAETAAAIPAISPSHLIAQLAQHPSPRLRDSLIALFLRHPEYAAYVPELVERLPVAAADSLRHLYTAAVYMQRFWHITLNIYLGSFTLLPDYFGQLHYHLPSPSERFGEIGLRQLAYQMEQTTGYEWLTVYESAISLLLLQLELENEYSIN